ncbi:hypothetical protein QR98_0057530 [Sarcoptes scabiei]|uniref:Uncharacterized protein n=1 Tax=Sarcoptes scabiei TaxID=52283 RepID=A0A132A8I4_SARSC|nr:hypothetical protein QR98_0057530 [Sarcoptes scabiei]
MVDKSSDKIMGVFLKNLFSNDSNQLSSSRLSVRKISKVGTTLESIANSPRNRDDEGIRRYPSNGPFIIEID